MKNNASMPSSRLSLYTNLIKIIFAILLIGFVLSQTELSQLEALPQKISIFWLVSAFLIFPVMTLIKALQYYMLLEKKATYPDVLNVTIVQNAISNFVATSAGIAYYLTLFKLEQGIQISRTAMAFIITKTGDLISIWLFLLISGLWVWPQIASLHGLVIFLFIGISVLIVIFFITIFLRQSFVSLLTKLFDGIHISRISLVLKGLNILHSIAQQEQNLVLRMVRLGTVYSLIYLSVTMTWIYATLKIFDIQIGIIPVVFVNSLMQLVSFLPIQVFGGLGVNETTIMYLYGSFDLPRAEIAAALIGIRILLYLMSLTTLIYLPLHTLFFRRSKISNQAQ